MPVKWTISDNILPDVAQEIREACAATLDGAGQLFKSTAYRECPVSTNNAPGYVHLRDTIGYEVDTESTFYQQFVQFYVVKDYAHFINDGTSRMAPRPFFSDGMMAVDDHFEDVVRDKFRDLMMGRTRGAR